MRITRWSRYIAVAAATALSAGIAFVAPATVAQAAATVTVSSVTTVAAARNVPINFTINGNANGWNHSFALISTRAAVGYRSAPPKLTYSGNPAVGVPYTMSAAINADTTPGRYRLAVYAYLDGSVAASGYGYLTVLASTNYSRTHTGMSVRGTLGKAYRSTFKVDAPTYQAGASAKVYYKAKGSKKYVKVASGRLNSLGDARMVTKKGKIRKTGRFYIKIGGVAYAGGYKTKTVKTYITW